MKRPLNPNHLGWCLCASLFAFTSVHAEWSGWRGGDRTGIVNDGVALHADFPEEDWEPVWRSDEVPSDHDGGHGSVVLSNGRLYLASVWVTRIPSETRTIDQKVLSSLGVRSTKMMGDEVVAAMEKARLERTARLRGDALKEWADDWVKEHLDEASQLALGSWVASRLVKGKSMFSIEDMDKVSAKKDHEFANHDALVAWMEEEGFAPDVQEKIVAAVPNTKGMAEDAILCLDAETGKQIWRSGIEEGVAKMARKASATPLVSGGQVYAIGSTGLHAIEVETGAPVWTAELPKGGVGAPSSALAVDDLVIVLANGLRAFSRADGSEVWALGKESGDSSPVVWEVGGKRWVVVNGSKTTFAVDIDLGELAWEVPGGGASSPVAEGDHLVVLSKNPEVGFASYKINAAGDGVEQIWNHTWVSRRYHSTPIIHEGHAYLFGCDRHLCVSLETGEEQWNEVRQSNITSPVLADGKFFTIEKGGSFLTAVAARSDQHEVLASSRVGVLACPTPAIGGGKVYLRHKDHVVCYDIAAE